MTPRPPVQTPATDETHLRHYWKVFWQGRYTVLAVFLLVVAVTAIYTFLQQPVYRATAVVEIQPKSAHLVPGQDVAGLGVAGYGGWWAEEKYHNTQIEIIKSRDVAERAFRALGLDVHPAFEGLSDPEEALRRRIQVDPRRETGLIEISIHGSAPEEITRWVNAVADAYVARNLEQAQERVALAVGSISEQVALLQADLQTEERDRMQVLLNTKIFDPDSQREIARQNLAQYQTELTKARMDVTRLSNLLAKIRELQEDGADPLTLPELQKEPVLQELNRQKLGVEREIEIAKVTLKPSHPDYEKKIGELAKVQQRIDNEVGRFVAGLRNQYTLARQNEEDLLRKLREAEGISLDLVEATSRYEIASTGAETKKRLYDLITKTMEEVELSAGLLSNNVQILDPAKIPLYPVKPRKRVNLVIGAMFGLFLGVGVVFFLDYLDNTFRTPDDIEKYLGLSVLSVIPRIHDQQAGARAIKEAYQSLRTSVIFSSKNRQRKTVLLTSTGPQEGKSSATAHLGSVLANAGERVVIVDCDLRRPTQHVQNKVPREHGLTNYLAAPEGQTDWSTYLKSTDNPNLQVIVCGPIPPSPPELLGSERFKRLLRELRENYDWVLLDSPPAASLADSSLLAVLADMVVLVVRHNHTDRDLVSRTVQQLRGLNATVVGAVLNNVDLDRAFNKDYYYAGYYYYHEEGGRRRKGPQSKARASAG